MDEAEKIISRLNGIDATRPYFEPLAIEEAVRRHARLIGFRDVSFSWAMGPQEAAGVLAGVDWDSAEANEWHHTMQALEDQAAAELQRDPEVWKSYRKAQAAAEQRIADSLHIDHFMLAPLGGIDEEAAAKSHSMTHLVSAFLRDVIASSAVASERLEDVNEAYLPFADAMSAGLGSFWVIGQKFVCLPLPRLHLENGKLVDDGSPAAVWPNGEAYALDDEELKPVLQAVEW